MDALSHLTGKKAMSSRVGGCPNPVFRSRECQLDNVSKSVTHVWEWRQTGASVAEYLPQKSTVTLHRCTWDQHHNCWHLPLPFFLLIHTMRDIQFWKLINPYGYDKVYPGERLNLYEYSLGKLMFHCPSQLTTMETSSSLKCTLVLRGLSSPWY